MMTPIEFKHWFDGFAEGIKDIPTEEQWARIKLRISQIDGKPAITVLDDDTDPLEVMNAVGRAEGAAQ